MSRGFPDRIEFLFEDRLIATVESSFTPDRGDKVNIRKQTYVVIGRTWTLDYAGEPGERMSCIINLAKPDADAETSHDQ